MKRVMLPAAMFVCLCAVVLSAFERKGGGDPPGQFDYYLLSISWAPQYCAGHPKDRSAECRAGQHANFVLHGLWPQSSAGQPPTHCVPAKPVSRAIAKHMLMYFPTRGLIQHEWAAHGTCSRLNAADYFGKVEQAFNALRIPDQYRTLDHRQKVSVNEIEQAFAAANGAPAGAFRVSCHDGGLVGVEACLTKDLQFQACTAGARECAAPQVLMRPVK